MSTTTSFQLTITCKFPNRHFSRKIPFAWKPSSDEIAHSITRLRKQASAAGVVGIIAVLIIVISGIQISMDQGGGESVTSAKNRIMQSLAGLVILFLSALILYTINPTFFK